MTWVSWVIVLSSAIAIGVIGEYLYRVPQSSKKWLRLFEALMIFFTGFLYLLSVATDLVRFPDQGPIFARPAFIPLIWLFIVEVIHDRIRRR